MNDLRRVTLGEITSNFDSRRVPIKTTERRPGLYPYYGASGIIDSVEEFIFDGEYLLIAEDGENLRSRSTPIAFLASGQFWVNNHAHVVQGNAKAATRFLAHLLSITEVSGYLTGSTQPKLTRRAMDSIELNIPVLGIQQAIAEVLGALDDKIAANIKLAATADEYIRTNLAELTSDIDDVITIGKLATNRKDLRDPTSLDPNSNYVGLEHIPRRSMWLDAVGAADSVTSTKAGFQPGDVLFGKLRPYFHKVVAAPFAGICSTDILVVTSIHEYLAEFVLASIASDYVVERVTAASEGTRMPRTSWKDLAAVEVGWPGEEKARQFSASVAGLRRSIESLIRENAALAATRDALLPQLMSGKLRVKDAEALVSATV